MLHQRFLEGFPPLKKAVTFVRTAARFGFLGMAWLFVAMIFVQVFHAGMAVLATPGMWGAHVQFGHQMSLPLMLMAVLSLIGLMGARFFFLSLALYGLLALQYATLQLARGMAVPSLAALHPVNALVIVLAAVYVARSAGHLLKNDGRGGQTTR